eukprot:g4490.t1
MFRPLLVFACFRAVCGDSAFPGSLDRAEVRKKDAPVAPQAVLAMLEMQERQAARIAAYQRDGKRRVVLARSNATLLRDRAEWLVPCEHESYQESHAYSSIANCTPTTCRRIVRDGFATAPEAALLAAATEMAMVNLFHQGGTTSLVPDSQGGPRLGVPAHRLVQDLQDRARRQIEDDFLLNSEENISRPLIFNSGAMLTRLKAEHVFDEWEVNPNHVYWNAHVDKANIASYDYSALLYLNTHFESPPPGSTNQGQEQMSTAFTNAPAHSAINGDLGFFEGGEFAFIDEDADRVVQPLAGRLVTFSSGLENLHRVEQVTRGTRYVLAMWFTCSEAHRYKDKADLGGDGGEGQEGRAIADHDPAKISFDTSAALATPSDETKEEELSFATAAIALDDGSSDSDDEKTRLREERSRSMRVNDDIPRDVLAKLLVVGRSAVGKTQLINRFCFEDFQDCGIATIGIDYKTKKIRVRDKIVQLLIWDSAGNERFRTITESYYRGVSGIVIVYDVCYRNSFEEVENFFVQIRHLADINVNVVLVGAKCELGTQDDKHHAAAGYSARA